MCPVSSCVGLQACIYHMVPWAYQSLKYSKIYGYNSSQSNLPHRLGTHMPYRITQCYLPPGRGDIPAFLPQPKLVLDYASQEGCKAVLPGWLVT